MKKKTTTILIGILTGTMAILISGCSNNSSSQSIKNTSTSAKYTKQHLLKIQTASDIATTAVDSAESVTSIKKDGYLAIPIAGLSQTASFYKADLDGTEVELVALKDSKGNLRTAFNACQVCYSSGRGIIVRKVSIWYARTVEIPLRLIKSALPLAAAILGRFSILTAQLLMMKFRFLMMS